MITKNSKDKLIHSTVDGIENFWKWFGDSKVVDNEGRPLVVYHGTRWNFDEFKKTKSGKSIDVPWSNFGFFFTEDPKLASKFSKGKRWNKNSSYLKGSNVMPVYLSMKNPYYLKAYRAANLSNNWMGVFNLKNDCITNGHDGIIIGTYMDSWNEPDRTGELNTPQYIVFSPNQIKSVTGNIGMFGQNSFISEKMIYEKMITKFKIFEGTWNKTFLPVTSKKFLALYYKCLRCDSPVLSINRVLTQCDKCGSNRLKNISEDEFYENLKSKVSPDGWKIILQKKKEFESDLLDLTLLNPQESPRTNIN
jgi:Zn finger protein HypA/HybF involved in hydrogenase expression